MASKRDSIINLAPELQAAKIHLVSKRLISPGTQLFRASFPPAVESRLDQAESRISENTDNFRGTFIIAPRGGGKSQALFELAIRILDRKTDDILLPVFVQCSNWSWGGDLQKVFEQTEKEAKENLIHLLKTLKSPPVGHVWDPKRKRLEEVSKFLQKKTLPNFDGRSLSQIINSLKEGDKPIHLILMFEDFDKQPGSNNISYLSQGQNVLGEWALNAVFTMQPNAWNEAEQEEGCNWVITTGSRFKGAEEVQLPEDLTGNAAWVFEAMDNRMKHVQLQPDGRSWRFINDSEPDIDRSRFEGKFINLKKLYDDYGLATLINIAQASKHHSETGSSIRAIIKALNQVLNSIDPNAADAGPLEVKEVLQEDSTNTLGESMNEFCESLEDQQVQDLHDFFNLIEEDATGTLSEAIIEGLNAARTYAKDNEAIFSSASPEHSQAFMRIAEGFGEYKRREIRVQFRKLGLLATTEGEAPSLGIFTDKFCHEWTQRDWINDSTAAVFTHISNAIGAPLQNAKQQLDLSIVTNIAEEDRGKATFTKSFQAKLTYRLKKLDDKHTLDSWTKIPPRDRHEIQFDFFGPNNFPKWLKDAPVSHLSRKNEVICGESINRLQKALMKVCGMEILKDNTKFTEIRLERFRRVYYQFFMNRGLKEEAWAAFQTIIGDDSKGKNPKEFDEELRAMVEACHKRPIPPTIRQLIEGSENTTNASPDKFEFIRKAAENKSKDGWTITIDPHAKLNHQNWRNSLNQIKPIFESIKPFHDKNWEKEKDLLSDFTSSKMITVASEEWNTAFGQQYVYHNPVATIAAVIRDKRQRASKDKDFKTVQVSVECRFPFNWELENVDWPVLM